MIRGDSRLSSNSFSETAHPLPGELGVGGGMKASSPSAAQLPRIPAPGTNPGFAKGLEKITDI